MNFDRTDIPKMAIAAAVAGLIVFIALYKPTRPFPPSKGERLSWNEAQKRIDEYLKDPIMVDGVKGDTAKVALQGFSMDAQDINEILNHNQSGIKDTVADKLMLYFSKSDDEDGVSRLQLIAAGVEDGNLMRNPDGNSLKSSVFNRADPCPPEYNCPK